MRSERKLKQLVPTTYTLIALIIIIVVVVIFHGADVMRKFAFSVQLHISLVPFSVVPGLLLIGCLLLRCHDLPGSSKLFGYVTNCSLRILLFKLRALITAKEKEARSEKGKRNIILCIIDTGLIHDIEITPIISSLTP
jgi:hypothetical protein